VVSALDNGQINFWGLCWNHIGLFEDITPKHVLQEKKVYSIVNKIANLQLCLHAVAYYSPIGDHGDHVFFISDGLQTGYPHAQGNVAGLFGRALTLIYCDVMSLRINMYILRRKVPVHTRSMLRSTK
jgi:hypothetical protein